MSGQSFVLVSQTYTHSSGGSAGGVAWEMDQTTASRIYGAMQVSSATKTTVIVPIENDGKCVYWYEGAVVANQIVNFVTIGFKVPILPAMKDRPSACSVMIESSTNGIKARLVGFNNQDPKVPVIWTSLVSQTTVRAMLMGLSAGVKTHQEIEVYAYGRALNTSKVRGTIYASDIDKVLENVMSEQNLSELEALASQSGTKLDLLNLFSVAEDEEWLRLVDSLKLESTDVSGSYELGRGGLLEKVDRTIDSLLLARSKLSEALIVHAFKEVEAQRDYTEWLRLKKVYGDGVEEDPGVKRKTR